MYIFIYVYISRPEHLVFRMLVHVQMTLKLDFLNFCSGGIFFRVLGEKQGTSPNAVGS